MDKVIQCMVLAAALAGSAAWAQDDVGRTEVRESEVTRGVFDSPVSIAPRAGIFAFGDAASNYTSRITEGLTVNWNFSPYLTTGLRVGLESGFLYSHLGQAGANFFGSGGTGVGAIGAGSNMFLFPIHVVAGSKIGDKMMLTGHLGTSALYRSIGGSMQLGRADDASLASSTEFFPSFGLNAGYAVSRSLGLSVRGDYIPTPASDLFTATLGATLALG